MISFSNHKPKRLCMKKNSILISSLTLISLYSCNSEAPAKREIASVNAKQPALFKGEVWGSSETENLKVIGDIFRDTLIDSTGNNEIMKRDAHPKHHGCVDAKLSIDNTKLPANLRVGLFEENKEYSSIIRFSNGDPDFTKEDIEKDVRGMAIKILDTSYSNYLTDIGVENESVHDLVMMNADAFFIANPKAYEKFMRSTKGRFGVLGYLMLHWNTLRNILKARVQVANSLDVDYSSATPYRLGNKSMKMKMVSCKKNKDELPKNPSPNFLSQRLGQTLASQEGCFDFYVQPNMDENKNNIENAMLFWDEKKSPMIKVGRMSVVKQKEFLTKDKMKACEDMSFNPWRAHELNRPLGGVNRIRLEVYLNQSKLRADHNKN